MVEKIKEAGITLGWGKILVIVITLVGAFVASNAQSNGSTDKKIKEVKTEQEKKHDKIDLKFEKLMDAMSEQTIELAKVVVILKERTH